MRQRVPISQIMSKELVTLTPDQSLYEAERLFKKHHIRHIPVVEGDKLIGIVSYSDLLRISFADMTDGEEEVTSVVYDMYTIPQIMAKTPLTVTADTSIKEVAEILAAQSFHSIPVVDNGKTCRTRNHYRFDQIPIRTILNLDKKVIDKKCKLLPFTSILLAEYE